ncbi:MAG TPA: EboA domain-containing protein [Saprospiraceae bacterium]|nr:EboA domain-containing protein [Saprospiraceae bacterium]
MKKAALLFEVLRPHLRKEKELPWVEKKLAQLQEGFKARSFFLAFSSCPRFIQKEKLFFSEAQLAGIQEVYPNFAAQDWSKEELVRVLFMCQIPVADNHQVLDTLFETADIKETIALYKGLLFLENADTFVLRAREGLRTNMTDVFDAIALNNPFPFLHLSEDAWNHMVLKAMFMGRPLYKVYEIEKRKNQKLALIFLDYAHERWSAHRKVSPELWRFVSGFVDESFFEDIKRTIKEGEELERLAAIKALQESNYLAGSEWLSQKDLDQEQVLGWDELGKQVELQQITSG